MALDIYILYVILEIMIKNKKSRILYNPQPCCAFQLKNTVTGEIIIASTLSVRDQDKKPWRSPKGTKYGDEFFKMKSGTKRDGFIYYKIMNSSLSNKSHSDDGKWEFIGKKTNGETVPKCDDVTLSRSYKKKKNGQEKITTHTRFHYETKSTDINLSFNDIRKEILGCEYSDKPLIKALFSSN